MQIFTIIKNHSWLGIDELNNYHYLDKVDGSIACRLFLQRMQETLGLTGSLIDDRFPYYLADLSPNIFLSFSHSREHIAVLLSKSKKLGVDIEDKRIHQSVAKRYFHSEENEWLETLSEQDQLVASGMLWTLKESLIKLKSSHTTNLFIELKKNIFDDVPKDQLSKLMNLSPTVKVFPMIKLAHRTFGFLRPLNCSFVIDHQD